MDIIIRLADNSDLPDILKLLAAYDLPAAGVEQHINNFFVATQDGKIVGTIGLEVYGHSGFLRSAAVHLNFQNKGIGTKLFNTLITYAKSLSLSDIFLLTNSAEEYFADKGFEMIKREEVATEVLNSEEFKDACPATAVCMYFKI